MVAVSSSAPSASPLFALLDLSRRARQAGSVAELRFLLVNDSHALASYRQAALWWSDQGVQALSGVVQIEANAPYAQWLDRVCEHCAQVHAEPQALSATDLPSELAQHWADWLPVNVLWLPLNGSTPSPGNQSVPSGGLLLARDLPWTAQETGLLFEWLGTWLHAWRALAKPSTGTWRGWFRKCRQWLGPQTGQPWWKQSRLRWAAAVLAVLAVPVRLTVLAPGELVPASPMVIRAPLDGVVDVFHVQPNQMVKKGQPLFGFDEALIQSRLEVAAQTLATAETEYRQTSQQALVDAKFRAQLATLTGKIEEKRAEVDYLSEQLNRSRVPAPQDGVVLFDDPSEWIGRPVAVGERIMRIADPADTEVEAWLPLADAIALAPDAPVTLYLNASPLAPVSAQVRYQAHDAVQRPDGGYAYRVRARLDQPTSHRVGLKGTAKLHGGWVPLAYWMLRRPLASARTVLGI
jgi:HlyD family secretion protein